jgi:hypothetical protein
MVSIRFHSRIPLRLRRINDVGDDSGDGAGHDAECHPEQRGEDPQDEANAALTAQVID